MMTSKATFTGLFLAIVFLSSCDKKDPVIPNEEEVITTLNFTLTPTAGGTPIVLTFRDLDGDGGNAPIITGGTLAANQSYSGTLELLNEQASPADNITDEILAEAEAHQFFFQSNIAGLSIGYNDHDANGDPIGLKTAVNTANAGAGTLTVTLRHEPNKAASGVTTGDITNAGGETDIAVSFELNVE